MIEVKANNPTHCVICSLEVFVKDSWRSHVIISPSVCVLGGTTVWHPLDLISIKVLLPNVYRLVSWRSDLYK